MTMLAIEAVEKHFRGVRAVDGVSFVVAEGELLGLVGPNGSGKTTLLNILSGFLDADGGAVRLEGVNVLGLTPDRLARQGLLRMFQMTRVFARMSAYDNLITAGLALGLDEASSRRRAGELLGELKLTPVAELDAGQLSGGQKKLLEFGACFMAPPRIALLDEPFAAVHPTMKQTMAEFILRRHREGQTFIVVSHDMPIVVELCARTVCMNAGRVIGDGPTQAVLSSHEVIEAYLGSEAPEVAHG